MHYWSDDDNLIAYCLYRFGNDVFGEDRHEIGDALGMGYSSLNLKIANFKAIDGLGGLEQYSKQAVSISTRYSKLPDDEVLQAGNEALQRASKGKIKPQMSSSPHSSLSEEALEEEVAHAKRELERIQALLTAKRSRTKT